MKKTKMNMKMLSNSEVPAILITDVIDWMKTKPEDERYEVQYGYSCFFHHFLKERHNIIGDITLSLIEKKIGHNGYKFVYNVVFTAEDDDQAPHTFGAAIERAYLFIQELGLEIV